MPVHPGLPRHGGDLAAAKRRYGIPEEPWLDLSTGINPRPYPLPPLPAECWSDLPDADAEASLLAAAARYYGTSPQAGVVAAAGTQALIQWLPRLYPPSTVAVVGPTYAEHAVSWTLAGHRVCEVPSLEAAAGADVVVVVNPNNPDGRSLSAPSLEKAATEAKLLVVDEAFADVAPETSVAAWAGRPGLVVLRSFGKFFGLAGVRLGFALADRETAKRLRVAQGGWAVSGPAMRIGTQALSDRAWTDNTRRWLEEQAGRVDAILAGATLSGARLEILGGTALFRLVRCDNARLLADHLGHRGILTRAFAYGPHWLRVGLPADDKGLARLARALAE